MALVENFVLRHPDIAYRPDVEPVPETSKTTRNVTITNAERAREPSAYEVRFLITYDVMIDERKQSNATRVDLAIPCLESDKVFDITIEAGSHLSAVLRELADQVEGLVEDILANKEGD